MIAVLHKVHAPVFRRVDAQFFGHDVRLAFARKRTLRVTRRAHVAAGEFIGVDVFFFDVGVGNPVRPRSFVSADEKTLRAVSAVSTAVKNIFHLMSDQYAVFFYAGFDLDRGGVARIPSDQFLGIVDQKLHRPAAALLGQGITKRDFVRVSLASEIAANIAWVNDQVGGRNLQRASHLLAHGERAFGRSPDLRSAIGFYLHQAGMWLDISLMNRRHMKSIFNHHVGLSKSLLHVSFVPGQVNEYIARSLDPVQQPFVLRHVGMEQRRVRFQRRQRIRHRGQFLIFHFDLVNRSFGRCFRLRRHSGNFFTDVAHHAIRQNRHIDDPLADPCAGNILPGHHYFYAGNGKRLGHVDPFYPAVRDGTAQDLDPKHIRQKHIHGIDGFTTDLLFTFDSGTWNA